MSEQKPLRALEELLRKKPYPEPFQAAEVEATGLEMEEAMKRSADLSPLEVINLYLFRSGAPVVENRYASLLADVSLLSRLCRTYLGGKVAGRVLVDAFQALLTRLTRTAQQVGYDGTAELEPLWVELDCYPDLESEKNQRSATNDGDLRIVAKKALTVLDRIWRDLLVRSQTQAENDERRHR